ncbi:MAG: TonB-dependent receptor [Pseudomonadota bacterium]
MTCHTLPIALLAVLTLPPRTALSAPDADGEIVVEEERPPPVASAVSLDREEIEAFPARSADDLLQAMPGLHESAHGGHGKAYQYFIRGFDAVHGADLAVTLDGIPLNEVSNIHGDGYLDLHFLPTLLVQGLDLTRGASRPDVGDFGIAAAADFHLGLAERGLLVEGGGGTDRSGLARLAWGPGAEPGTFLVAEAEAGEGGGEHRAWREARLGGGVERWFGRSRARAFALGHLGRFESPGVLRADDLEAGEVDFYGAYPESGGGASARLLLGADLARSRADRGASALTWGWLRGLDLTRNFTGYAQDAEHGDGLLQAQRGGALGARARAWRRWPLGARDLLTTGGLDGRLDLLHQWEQAIAVDGTPWEDRIDATVRQGDLGAWALAGFDPWPWLRLEPGLRVEWLGAGLLRHIDDEGAPVAEPAWAFSWAPLLCPRASAVLLPERPLSLFADYGRGFRSPEARGIEDGDRAPVSTADTEEAGLRWRPSGRVELTLVGFHTFVSNEIIFDHAAARFLASGATRRVGGEATAALSPWPWLRTEWELTWADGRYVASGEALPYAPRWLASGGLGPHGERGDLAWNSGLRGWFLGPRPLPEGFYSRAAFVLDATAHLTWRHWVLDVEVDNLLGTHWRDGEFVYPSWFDRGQRESELPALHITAGDPFAVRIAIGRRFS